MASPADLNDLYTCDYAIVGLEQPQNAADLHATYRRKSGWLGVLDFEISSSLALSQPCPCFLCNISPRSIAINGRYPCHPVR